MKETAMIEVSKVIGIEPYSPTLPGFGGTAEIVQGPAKEAEKRTA
jgi:hypothetical protein